MSAALLLRYRDRLAGSRLRYWKPIQTGIEEDDDTATVRQLARCRPDETLEAGVRLERPVSPHLAARLSGRPIDVEALVQVPATQPLSDRWIVEGAGGALVPIDDATLMVDLMVRLALPVVIVGRTTLGTINHTLLTIEAVRARSLTIAGVVLSGVPDAENRAAIEHHGAVAVIGELASIDPLTPESLARWASHRLDPFDRLLEVGL